MEPRIQYAKTSDGVSIAYWTLGEGPPLVYPPSATLTHIQLEWQWPQYRRWYERLAEKRTLVRYDTRGSGLSDRNVTDHSLEAWVLDLQAVVDRLGLGKFAVLGWYHAGPVAITYAVRHPERISRLLLWCSYAGPSDVPPSPRVEAVRSLVHKDWELYTETLAHDTFGFSEGEQADRLVALIRECITPEGTKGAYLALPTLDATDLLSQVNVPTLVLHRRQLLYPAAEVARRLASRIPDARLALLEGAALWPLLGDTGAVLEAIDEFLSEGEEAAVIAPEPPAGALRTVLFTDLVGHTEMMSRLGDEKGRAVLRDHERITREVLRAHDGAEVKTMGDGFMASFGSVTKALECAIALQQAFAEREGEPLSIRIGLNAGEPIEEDGDLFGATVILASRIAAKAEGGEILVPETVRGLCSGKGFLFADRGEFVPKGFEDPVRIHEVVWRDA